MNILITGGNGMLGRTITKYFSKYYNVISLTHEDLDITDENKVFSIIKKYNPDIVIHCAALTNVDLCETEKDKAFYVNAFGTGCVAAACFKCNVRLIYISTDYVFDGILNRPYTEYDIANGGNTIYGQSKFAGETYVRYLCPNHVICRVSWLYGSGTSSFIYKIMTLSREHKPFLNIVNDQHGNPTSALSVAHELKEIINRPNLFGTFHITCEGEATWYEFATEIFKINKNNQVIKPCTSSEYISRVKRPKNSCLDKMMIRLTGLPKMPHWKIELKNFLDHENI